MPLLTMLLVVPVLGALLLGVLVPRQSGLALKVGATGVALINLLLVVVLWARFDPAQPGLQFEENVPWIRALSFQVNYHLGVDGISLLLVALTAFLMVLAFLGSWNVTERVKEYVITLLVLESAMLGVFLAADLLLFYIFWEVTMIPMFLLIGIWGGARRIYASIKFVLFTAAGSLVMLVAMVSLAWTYSATTGQTTFDLEPVLRMRLPVATQVWLFAAFALAFAIKVPLFPLHTWLPDAHVEAPTAGSVILAGVLLKMGTYGFLRFCLTLFPEASYRFAPILVALALVGIVYGALVALAQQDIKKLVAYSSISHLGFVMLGLFALNAPGLQGSLLQMINHGISTGALFLLVGMIYERRHTRLISDYGGLWKQMPLFSALFLVVALSSIALPFTNGFVGEFLILLGAFNARVVWAAIAVSGMILSAAYMLWMYQRVFFGPLENPENRNLADLNRRELAILVPIVVLIFSIGVAPRFFLRPAEPALQMVLMRLPQPGAPMLSDARVAPALEDGREALR
ncbi:MAG: NADH-quinone oxidoreductase subunit M [Armatimonadetes bacterium]|nr:NADH-quinone oxidoreductase subunit M [Armatimonadota bacterium]